MHLIFFDESKNDDNYPSYHIGGIVIDDIHLLQVEKRINEAAKEIFGNSRLTRETEFHAVEVFHRKGNFKKWNEFDARLDVLRRLIGILNLECIDLIDIKINDNRLHSSQSPEQIAFMFLCERANDLMKTKKSLGMLIGDRENDKSAAKYAGSLSDYKARGTGFEFGREITHLVDSVHFTQSHLSRFLQLADVYTWLLQFKSRNRRSKNQRHMALFDLLRRDDVDLFPAKYKTWP